jgi:hypothetical protein
VLEKLAFVGHERSEELGARAGGISHRLIFFFDKYSLRRTPAFYHKRL